MAHLEHSEPVEQSEQLREKYPKALDVEDFLDFIDEWLEKEDMDLEEMLLIEDDGVQIPEDFCNAFDDKFSYFTIEDSINFLFDSLREVGVNLEEHQEQD
jgi:hypothetical protein